MEKQFDSTRSNTTVLLVDDEQMVLTTLSKILSRRGFAVLLASNATDAYNIWTNYREEIFFVITDFKMPGGTGLELLTRIYKEKLDLRSVILTGGGIRPCELKQIQAMPNVKYLSKPALSKEILSVVMVALTETVTDSERGFGES